MNDLEEKLGAILSNQEAMSQIMALAKNLGGGNGGGGSAPQPLNTAEETPPSPPPETTAGTAGLGLDPRLLSMAAKLAGAYSSAGDDRRVILLNALRPFVRPERHAKLDKAIQIARMTRVIRIALDSFRAKGEGYV